LTAKGFQEFAEATLGKFPNPAVLPDFSRALLDGIHQYRGHTELDDDITLLTLRRVL